MAGLSQKQQSGDDTVKPHNNETIKLHDIIQTGAVAPLQLFMSQSPVSSLDLNLFQKLFCEIAI